MIGKYNDDVIALPTADDAGCWIDGHWGQYAIARMASIAGAFGFEDASPRLMDIVARKLASMGPNGGPDITPDEEEYLFDSADEVEEWLNDNIAPEGYVFAWYEGEFFLTNAADLFDAAFEN